MTVGGRHLTIRVTSETSNLLSWKPDWKTRVLGRMLNARPGAFIDVGANVGQTFLDYCHSSSGGGYWGFEPTTTCVAQIRRVIRDNNIGSSVVVPVALADANRLATMFRHFETDPAATLVAGLRPTRITDVDIVPCYRLDDVRDSVGLTGPVGVIKIDVEGAECATVNGLVTTLQSDAPWILCEVLDRDGAADVFEHRRRCNELFMLLRSLDYNVLRIVKTSNLSDVHGLEMITAFPTQAFSEATREACDYLFVPAADEEHVKSVLLGHE